MNIHAFTSRGVHVISCSGALESSSGDDGLYQAFEMALASGVRYLILDFSGLDAVDSAGIGTVVHCAKRAAEVGAELKLVVAGSGPVHTAFTVARLDRAFDIFDDLGPAAASFTF